MDRRRKERNGEEGSKDGEFVSPKTSIEVEFAKIYLTEKKTKKIS